MSPGWFSLRESRLFSNKRLNFLPKSAWAACAAEGRAAGLDPTWRPAAGLVVTMPAQDESREGEGRAFSLSLLPILRFECAKAVSGRALTQAASCVEL